MPLIDKLLDRLGLMRKLPGVLYIDECINALWNAGEDERRVDKEFFYIQDGRLYGDAFEMKLRRVLNDQTARFEDGTLFDPVLVPRPKIDMVVNPGLIRIAQLVTGKSSQYFTYFASGTGIAEEKISDNRLSAENYRVSMISDGFAEPVGTAMKFAGKFPNVVPTATITEGGVFDFGEFGQGTMLFRTLYPQESRLPHVQYRSFYTLTQTISQIPVT
jgi:hypothetical protein